MYFQPTILVGIREETERLIIKCIWRHKGSRTTKAIKKENYEKKDEKTRQIEITKELHPL